MPSRARRSPPMPNVSSFGSSRFSSRTTSDACRSPDASPATIASFTPALAVPGSGSRVPSEFAHLCSGPGTRDPGRFSVSFAEREWVHDPSQHNAADEQRAEDEKEKPDALFARVLPQQREVDAGGDGVDEHQHDVIPQQAHSFRPSAMSKASSISRRFISPAVIVNAVPCSYVIEVTSPCGPMPAATKYMIPDPIDPSAASNRSSEPPVCEIV